MGVSDHKAMCTQAWTGSQGSHSLPRTTCASEARHDCGPPCLASRSLSFVSMFATTMFTYMGRAVNHVFIQSCFGRVNWHHAHVCTYVWAAGLSVSKLQLQSKVHVTEMQCKNTVITRWLYKLPYQSCTCRLSTEVNLLYKFKLKARAKILQVLY